MQPRTDVQVGYSTLWADKEVTYTFVEDVIRAVAAGTPGPYLHIGGDEAFSTPPGDYRTFLGRVLPMVGKYGKRAIGWHEMAAAELPATAIPQYWRIEPADDGVARAAAAGHQVIMSPADRSYLDMKYDEDDPARPGLGGSGRGGAVLRLGPGRPAARRAGGSPARRRGAALVGDPAQHGRRAVHGVPAAARDRRDRLDAREPPGTGRRSAAGWPSSDRAGPPQGVNFFRSPEIDWR